MPLLRMSFVPGNMFGGHMVSTLGLLYLLIDALIVQLARMCLRGISANTKKP